MQQGKRQVWQIAGNPGERPHLDVFLQYGVALIGPGDPGPWSAARPDEHFSDEMSSSGRAVRAFASEMQVGDLVLLRISGSTIAAVGIVASDYLYLNQFDDVNGWDLQHARRVRWTRLPQAYSFDMAVFGGNPARCSRTWSEEAIEYAERFVKSPPTYWQDAALPALPAEEPPIGEVHEALREIVAQAQDLANLCWDRNRFGEHPAEDEMVAHFVVPLLRALGWPPERIAVKWRYIDVSLFSALPRTPESCCLVIEAKRLGAGVEGALGQGKGYVAALGKVCDVMVTDGIRYRLYDGKQDYAPVAYANLVRLKASAVNLFNRIRRV